MEGKGARCRALVQAEPKSFDMNFLPVRVTRQHTGGVRDFHDCVTRTNIIIILRELHGRLQRSGGANTVRVRRLLIRVLDV